MRSGTRPLVPTLVATLVLTLTPAGGLDAADGRAASPAIAALTPVAGPPASSGEPRRDRSTSIDRSDRRAVARAYRNRLLRGLSTPVRWDGAPRRCRAGRISPDAQRAALRAVNFMRSMGHLAPVRFTRTLSSKAQRTALIMSANDALSAAPRRSWHCWTRAGAEGASRSNAALFGRLGAAGPIVLYMDDPGRRNRAVGHRRWIMNPWATTMGNGSTTTANALLVVGREHRRRPVPEWVPWPTPGWFPDDLEPAGRWSLSATDDRVSFRKARVVVRDPTGDRLKVSVHRERRGYASPTVVFEVDGIRRSGARRNYTVTVSHVDGPGAAALTYRYRVRLFDV